MARRRAGPRTADSRVAWATSCSTCAVSSRACRIYYREIIAELRKVIYPSRQQLLTYTVVVLFFVSFMTALVAGLDYGLTKAVVALFS